MITSPADLSVDSVRLDFRLPRAQKHEVLQEIIERSMSRVHAGRVWSDPNELHRLRSVPVCCSRHASDQELQQLQSEALSPRPIY